MSLLTVIQLEILFVLALFLPLALQLVVLYLVSRGLWRFSGRYFGRGIWALLAFVGVPIHELSHAAAFLLTGAGVQRLVLFAPRGLSEYGGATGVTIPARQPSVVSRLVASIAPFFGCSLAAWLVLRLLLPGFTAADVAAPTPINSPETAGAGQVIGQILSAYPGYLIGAFARLQWSRWQTYLALYLGASLGMGAAPAGAVGGAAADLRPDPAFQRPSDDADPLPDRHRDGDRADQRGADLRNRLQLYRAAAAGDPVTAPAAGDTLTKPRRGRSLHKDLDPLPVDLILQVDDLAARALVDGGDHVIKLDLEIGHETHSHPHAHLHQADRQAHVHLDPPRLAVCDAHAHLASLHGLALALGAFERGQELRPFLGGDLAFRDHVEDFQSFL